jgi:hypothetical protein
VLAAPGGISPVNLEIRAGASPAVSFLLDEIDTGRVMDRVDPKSFLCLGNNQRSVLRPLLAGFKLFLGHDNFLLWVRLVLRELISA